jgi:uncharacterized protein YbjQ (UPF0145 family)
MDFVHEVVPIEPPQPAFETAPETKFGDASQFSMLSRSAPTPPPHLAPLTTLQQVSIEKSESEAVLSPNYCPHPHTIATTTRDIPPKGWFVTTEAGIVIGSSAAYHGSSVSKVSTKALTLVVNTLNEARDVATQNMLKAASHRGCNAVLGMKYDTCSPVPEITLVTAYGTACVIVKDDRK